MHIAIIYIYKIAPTIFTLCISEIMKKCLKIARIITNWAKKSIYLEGDAGKSPHQKHTIAKYL